MIRTIALILLLCHAVSAAAQDATSQDTAPQPPVAITWTQSPGFFTPTEGEAPTGFFGDLAQEIAARTGLTLTWTEAPDVAATIADQASGVSQMLPGAGRIPALEETNVFSEPVATSSVYLFVRSDVPTDLAPDTFDNRRVGVVASTVGADLGDTLGNGNTVTVYPDFNAALGALLFAEIDGLVGIYPGVMGALRQSRLDSRIRRVGPPLMQSVHVVSLHQSRADLMPRIQDALNAMTADGTLTALRREWTLAVPDAPPVVYTVGLANFPPYQMPTPNGFTGFGVEALRDLAELAGLPLRFVAINSAQFAEGPTSGTYDMLPLAGISPERQERMDFTLPLDSASFSVFVRNDSTLRLPENAPNRLTALAGRRIAVEAGSVVRTLLPEDAGVVQVPYPNDNDLLRAVADGEVDAGLYLTNTGRAALKDMNLDTRVRVLGAPLFVAEGGIALRFGLADTRERLNAVIPGYVSSARYESLRRQWYGAPVFWTPKRIRIAEIAAAALTIGAGLVIVLISWRGRRKAEHLTGLMQEANTRMAAILNATRGALLGLSRDGRIFVANPSARRMLGLEDADLPRFWPPGVAFLAREDMAPLEASHDPVQRALAGQILKGEVALLTVPGDRPVRYVRVSSAPVENGDPGEMHTVMILDDVSEQEANRQQLERASRLDALGQLTGGVAHDFNNLLATIEYAVQLALPETSPRAQRFLHTAQQTITRGAALTRRLLAFAKQQPGLARSAEVDRILEDFEALSRPTIEKTITLEFRAEEPGLWVHCDSLQLGNALLNLVLNSRDAILRSGKGDRITVLARAALHGGIHRVEDDQARVATAESLQAEGLATEGGNAYRYVEFSVSDNGPGMTDEVRRRAVDPFFSTRDTNSGTGLGLSMVYGFVQQSGGELRIYSELNEGTSVRLLLPRGTPDGTRERPVPHETVEEGQGETILVVEDDEGLVGMIRDLLEALNYSVLVARSGPEALEIIDAGIAFDLMLTDVVMPHNIGGFELARQLREKRPDTPFVYMSGYTGIAESEMGDAVGPLIQKPCPRPVLARVLRKQLTGD